MKKILSALIVIAVLLMGSLAMADDGTVTVSSTKVNGRDMEVFHFAFIANSGGVVPATSTTVETCQGRVCYPRSKSGYIWKVVSRPGSPNPAADFDITVIDDITSADLLGGEGADFSNTASAEVVPKIGNAYGGNPVYTSFTVNWSNVDNALAEGTIDVYIVY